jgi:phosphate transport system protein
MHKIVRLAQLTAGAMERATVAVEEADVALADDIVADSVRLDRSRDELARQVNTVFEVPAAAVPVLATIHALTELERMSGLVLQVVRIAQRAYPDPVVPREAMPDFVELGRIAVWLAELAVGDGRVRSLISVEDDLADLRRILARLTEYDELVTLRRCYERFAGHAVRLGRLLESVAPRSQAA